MLFVLFAINSCRKTERHFETGKVNRADKFFANTLPLQPQVQKIYDALKKQNEKNNFVDNLPIEAGNPVWDKIITKTPNNNTRLGEETNDSTAYIPLTNDNVKLSSVIKIKEVDSTLYDLKLYTNQYFYDQLIKPQPNVALCRYVLGLFILMDNHTFGTTQFDDVPKFLFPTLPYTNITNGTVKITLSSITGLSTGRTALFSDCTTENLTVISCGTPDATECENGCDWQNCPTGQCTGSITTLTVCDNNISLGAYDNGGVSIGSGSNSASGSGNTTTNPIPCNDAFYRTDAPPCWQPPHWSSNYYADLNNDGYPDIYYPFTVTNITDSLQAYPCVKGLISNIGFDANIGLQHNITDIIRKTFQNNSKFKVTYVPRNLGVAGRTIRENETWTNLPGTNVPTLASIDFKIALDTTYLTKASKMGISATAIHEQLHAYLFYRQINALGNPILEDSLEKQFGFLEPYNINNPYSVAQHEIMAKKFIDEMAFALQELFPLTQANFPSDRWTTYTNAYPSFTVLDYYRAVAWGGLRYYKDPSDPNIIIETKGWKEFKLNNPQFATIIPNIIAYEDDVDGYFQRAIFPKCN
jgi:hypothetical protein